MTVYVGANLPPTMGPLRTSAAEPELNVSQVATALGKSQRSVFRLLKAGKLPLPDPAESTPGRKNRLLRWKASTIRSFLEAGLIAAVSGGALNG